MSEQQSGPTVPVGHEPTQTVNRNQSAGDQRTTLARHPVVVALPLQWGDQDAFGHVNGVVYFRWFETARVEYLNQCGLSHLMTDDGLGPILAAIKCDYRRQLKYPDTILVSASISEIGTSSMKMRHLIYSQVQRAIVAEGESTVVMFDYARQRPTRVPDDVRQQIERMEGRTNTEPKQEEH